VNDYRNGAFQNCKCIVHMPNLVQYEVWFMLSSDLNNHTPLKQYLDFLKQWLDWLFTKENTSTDKTELEINPTSIQSHLNKLKIFHYTLKQDSIDFSDVDDTQTKPENQTNFGSIDTLLKANSEFLKNISKS
jgi:hypothetical protein